MGKQIDTKGEVILPNFSSEYSLSTQNSFDRTRHIFIFLDGTWNEERDPLGKTTPTNVLRMFQEIKQYNSFEQSPLHNNGPIEIIAHYYRGVGSRQDNNAANRLWFGFNGKDEERIRSAAFSDIYRHIKSENDRIYILGFSRGAASARLLARDICVKGLPPRLKVHTTHFPNLLTHQIEARVERVERLGESSEHKNYSPDIEFLGCWDTVDAFVLPARFPTKNIMDKAIRACKKSIPRLLGKERFRNEENEIPESVKKAVHCVAIDETRNAFLPTLMPHSPNTEEVWFPGVHSDVGGGYDDNLLSNGPYNFMKKRLIEASGLDEQNLFKSSSGINYEIRERQNHSPEYCFHYKGLNTGWKHAKDLLGFGTAIRKIRVLGSNDAKPKIHNSLFHVISSGSVYAADARNKRTWTITYDPYNVRELKEQFDTVSE